MADGGGDEITSIARPLTLEDQAALRSQPPLESIVVARPSPLGVPGVITEQLLPTERAVFATRPHAVVLIRPFAALIVIAIVLAAALTVHIHPIVAGHHVNITWLDARERIWALAAGGLAGLRVLVWLVKEAQYYAGFRIVATNRRVLIVDGVLNRRVKPLGNTAMASAEFRRGWLGTMFGFGTIAMPGGPVRDVRDPLALYREMQAVANGVDGDQWTPALRQTRIP
jgi:hypothetical protein